jgi:uncharacterized membrane protein
MGIVDLRRRSRRSVRLAGSERASSSLAELSPQQIAAQRFARGEINEQEYQHLLQVLSGGSAEISN